MRKFLTFAAAASLVAGTGAYAAAPVRATAPVEDASELSGGLPLSVILVLLAVLGGAIYLLVDGDDSPDSP